ncbi:MAG: ATP-binding cassette domain-containing protein [Actinomycetaceae bacterium]|nr:ATP-binding cassette domain-containing protein [Actinomycetaceae bacterium]MDY6083109.1 ATP-binding cassette domain-containing protein [Actinomycetaceae bacterium]
MIELHNVRKVYERRSADPVKALDGISLTVPDGVIHGIVGESGAGKSTLIRCLSALEKPTSGEILVNGQNLASLAPRQLREARRTIGMVFQGANLLDSRTAAGNIAFPLHLAKMSHEHIRSRVKEMLHLVGLDDRAQSYPSQLSGGQKQRVGIARAMADQPSVLLCDEPTSALDSETTTQILELLRSVRDQYGVTVLIITHEMSVVRRICDSVSLLDHGSIVASGQVSDVVADVASPLSRQIVPLPYLHPDFVAHNTIVDVSFTSTPGEPTGSRVLALAARHHADISAGSFETLDDVQVARLALSIEPENVEAALRSFQEAHVDAEVRR